MHRHYKFFTGINILLIIISAIIISSCYIVHDEALGNIKKQSGLAIYFEARTFNAKKYVADIWDSKVIPFVDKNAQPIDTIIKALKENDEKACKTYGYQAVPEKQNPYNFIVTGEGKVVTVNTKSRNGRIIVDLIPLDGKHDVTIQIGPVLIGQSIRDSMKFIHFGDFTNQLDWAKLSDELNSKVRENVLANIDTTKLKNKTISFTGCFSHHLGSKNMDILITPIRLKVKGK